MGSSSSKANANIKVVVVGGNIAGINTAKALESKGFAVTILEPREFAWISFAAFRASASPDSSWSKRMTVPLDRILKRGKVVRGTATGVNPTEKTVSYTDAQGAEGSLSFDYLVIATGATFATPFQPVSNDKAAAQAGLIALGETIRSAKNVVIVGGGPCGLEFAGEIRDVSPNATIRIVHSGKTLLSGKGNVGVIPALSAKLVERLAIRKIDLSLNDRLVESTNGTPHPIMGAAIQVGEKQTVTLSSGKVLSDVDLLVYATGSKPNSGWLRSGPLVSAVGDDGTIQINRSYAVNGFPGIFSLGDVASGPDAKAGWHLPSGAGIIAANIAILARTKKDAPVPKLKEGPKDGYQGILVVPIGKGDGAGLLPFGVVGPYLVKTIKGGDLFVGKLGADFGYKSKELLAL